MKRGALVLFAILIGVVLYACSGGGSSANTNADGGGACAADTDDPPSSLACTGLYADVASKTIATSARIFSPATPLWSDGATKRRFIALPEDQQIDNSDPNEWKFPVGTKAWKEFTKEGVLVETRYFHKQSEGYWTYAAYTWNADGSDAKRSGGGPVTLPSGAIYQVPSKDQCTECHRGRTDSLLGFEQVSLGLPGASGVTLATLAGENRLTVPPARTSYVIGDDGTGAAAPALEWIHINCGTACHNANSNAMGYAAGMRLRLDPTELDGRSSSNFSIRTTTIGVTVSTPQWSGDTRILPGDPTNSLLFELISRRDPDDQMPPIATDVVDANGVAVLKAWISHMPLLPVPDVDAGSDSGVTASADAGRDAMPTDGGIDADSSGDTGASSSDAGAPDGGESD